MVYKDSWRTPDFGVYPTTHWRFGLPDSVDVKKALLGALFLLTDVDNWTKVGTAEPETMVEVMIAVIDSLEEVLVMNLVGTIIPYASAEPPAGCLPCFGGMYNDADYPELAAVLDPAFSNGDGTFNTPDLSGRFLLGIGDSDYNPGDLGGEYEHTLIIAEIPVHSHQYASADAPTSTMGGGGFSTVRSRSTQPTTPTPGGGSGGNQPHNNMPPYLAINYCIVAVTT